MTATKKTTSIAKSATTKTAAKTTTKAATATTKTATKTDKVDPKEKTTVNMGDYKKRSMAYLVPQSALYIDYSLDIRDRDKPLYHENYAQIKAGIIQAGGIETPLLVYKGYDTEAECERLYVDDGRTRLTALREAIAEGRIDETVELNVIKRDIGTGGMLNATHRIASQMVIQTTTPFDDVELSGGIERMLKIGTTKTEVAKLTGFSITKIEKLINIAGLLPVAKRYVSDGKLALTVAMDLNQKWANSPEKFEDYLKKVEEVKQTSSANGKGKGKAKARIMKADIYYAELATKSDIERDQLISKQQDLVKEVILSNDVDPFLLKKIYELANKEFERQLKIKAENEVSEMDN